MNWHRFHDMTGRISPRDRRALKIAAATAVFILVYACLLDPWLDHWSRIRARLAAENDQLTQLAATRNRAAASVVPIMALPHPVPQQRLLFEEKFSQQLQQAGIAIKKLQYRSKGKKASTFNATVLQLQCRGSTKFDQVINLLTGLNENPHLMSIEQFDLQCGPEKKRQEMTIDLTVSTLARRQDN